MAMVIRDEFWKATNSSRIEAEYMVDDKLKYLQFASHETLQRIFHEYQFFINDLGILHAEKIIDAV